MSSFAYASAENILESYTKSAFEEEHPKINVAMKNLMAALIGKHLTAIDSDAKLPEFETVHVLLCAKCLSEMINTAELVQPPTWGHDHPQVESQSAGERVEQITKYKVMYMLYNRIKSNNCRVTKMLGKSFFNWTLCWPDIKKRFLDHPPNGVDITIVDFFLKSFEDSLVDQTPSSPQQSNLAELVWTNDFNEVLAKRRNKRNEEVKDRISNADAIRPDAVNDLTNTVLDIRARLQASAVAQEADSENDDDEDDEY